jgi:hypothetical protein
MSAILAELPGLSAPLAGYRNDSDGRLEAWLLPVGPDRLWATLDKLKGSAFNGRVGQA